MPRTPQPNTAVQLPVKVSQQTAVALEELAQKCEPPMSRYQYLRRALEELVEMQVVYRVAYERVTKDTTLKVAEGGPEGD